MTIKASFEIRSVTDLSVSKGVTDSPESNPITALLSLCFTEQITGLCQIISLLWIKISF